VIVERRVCLSAAVVLIASGAWAPAFAQAPSDKWDVTVAPYFMGAAMSGTTTVRGRQLDVEVSASDIFSNLQFGAMGVVVARKGKWGFGADAIWMALGTTVSNTNVDFNQGAFAFYGLRRLGAAADLTFGLRVNTLQGKLTFNALGVDVSQDKTWVDPLVGLILRSPRRHRVHAQVYTEIGGFGAGSDFTWQIFPTVGFKFTDRFSLELGYRWLDLDYKTGDGNDQFAYDVLTQGPIGGLAFRF
jgi:hypothetical protein